MTWTHDDVYSQCKKLEPMRYRPDGVFALDSNVVNPSCLRVWSLNPGVRSGESANDELTDLFMRSSEFDQCLFATLTVILDVDRMVALEICLS